MFVPTGGFGGNIGHDPHLVTTLNAVQILALFDSINVLDIDKVSNCILQHIGSPSVQHLFWCKSLIFVREECALLFRFISFDN